NVNSGLIAVQALHGFAYGIMTNNASTLDNRAGAQLLVEGMGAVAFATNDGGSPLFPAELKNAGIIRAVSLDPNQASIGYLLNGFGFEGLGVPSTFKITNSGILSADIAIYG